MTETRRNLAAYLDEKNTPFRVAEAPITAPGPNEIVIKVHAVAINPVDHARQSAGLFIPHYPYIIGCDGAGVIEVVGDGVSEYKPGDRVMSLSDEFWCEKTSHSMFQEYVIMGTKQVCKIPDSMDFVDAAVLPLAITTAGSLTFEKETLALRLPATAGEDIQHSDEVVVVWGGSSSVGACVIQLVKAAGYNVVGIARKHNFEIMRQAGAEGLLDYTDAGIVDEVCRYVESKGWKCAGVADAISTESTLKSCGEIALRLPGRKFVSTVLPRKMQPEPEMPEGVTASNCVGMASDNDDENIWHTFLPSALAAGQIKCLPPAELVGEGIESIDHACSVARKGVSGKKIVVKVC